MKQLNILKNNIQLTINDEPIDYHVEFDITGKIHHVYPLLNDLPETAQKLMLSKYPEEMLSKINALGQLLTFLLPLGIVRKIPSIHNQLEGVLSQIDEEIERTGMAKSEIYKYADHSSFGEKNIEISRIDELVHAHPALGFKLIPLLIPLLNNFDDFPEVYQNALVKGAFSSLRFYVDEECESYLWEELMRDKKGAVCEGIFEALECQKLSNPSWQTKLLNYQASVKTLCVQ